MSLDADDKQFITETVNSVVNSAVDGSERRMIVLMHDLVDLMSRRFDSLEQRFDKLEVRLDRTIDEVDDHEVRIRKLEPKRV